MVRVPFVYQRTIRFQDTDAAGVVYFANGLSLCHEAYEASLEASGIPLNTFFGKSDLAFPIVHASIDFLRPLSCGDRVEIHLTPSQTSASQFEIAYCVYLAAALEKPVILATTRHVGIDAKARSRHNLPPFMVNWVAQWGTPGKIPG